MNRRDLLVGVAAVAIAPAAPVAAQRAPTKQRFVNFVSSEGHALYGAKYVNVYAYRSNEFDSPYRLVAQGVLADDRNFTFQPPAVLKPGEYLLNFRDATDTYNVANENILMI